MIQILLSKNTNVLQGYYNSLTYTNNKTWLPESNNTFVELTQKLQRMVVHNEDCIIATHSEAIINQFSDYIKNGAMSCNNTCISIINTGKYNHDLDIYEYRFNEKGSLVDTLVRKHFNHTAVKWRN